MSQEQGLLPVLSIIRAEKPRRCPPVPAVGMALALVRFELILTTSVSSERVMLVLPVPAEGYVTMTNDARRNACSVQQD